MVAAIELLCTGIVAGKRTRKDKGAFNVNNHEKLCPDLSTVIARLEAAQPDRPRLVVKLYAADGATMDPKWGSRLLGPTFSREMPDQLRAHARHSKEYRLDSSDAMTELMTTLDTVHQHGRLQDACKT